MFPSSGVEFGTSIVPAWCFASHQPLTAPPGAAARSPSPESVARWHRNIGSSPGILLEPRHHRFVIIVDAQAPRQPRGVPPPRLDRFKQGETRERRGRAEIEIAADAHQAVSRRHDEPCLGSGSSWGSGDLGYNDFLICQEGSGADTEADAAVRPGTRSAIRRERLRAAGGIPYFGVIQGADRLFAELEPSQSLFHTVLLELGLRSGPKYTPMSMAGSRRRAAVLIGKPSRSHSRYCRSARRHSNCPGSGKNGW